MLDVYVPPCYLLPSVPVFSCLTNFDCSFRFTGNSTGEKRLAREGRYSRLRLRGTLLRFRIICFIIIELAGHMICYV